MNLCLSQSMDELWFQKIVGSLVFLWNQSINSFILMSGMNLWRPIIKERRLLCESVFIPIKKWTLILKMVEIEVLHMKPRHQYHLSQWGEWTYGAQSLNERRLLRESKFIQIERSTLVLKMAETEVFVTRPKHQYR